MTSQEVCIRKVTEEEVHNAWLIESLCFQSYEASSEESCKFRQREASELFWGYYESGQLIGITHGTKTSKNELTQDSLSTNDPDGKVVCVHSLCTHPEYRGKGVATVLMKHLIQHVRDNLVCVTKICLICHDVHINFYERLGFRCMGLSKLTRPTPMFDMVYSFRADE